MYCTESYNHTLFIYNIIYKGGFIALLFLFQFSKPLLHKMLAAAVTQQLTCTPVYFHAKLTRQVSDILPIRLKTICHHNVLLNVTHLMQNGIEQFSSARCRTHHHHASASLLVAVRQSCIKIARHQVGVRPDKIHPSATYIVQFVHNLVGVIMPD